MVAFLELRRPPAGNLYFILIVMALAFLEPICASLPMTSQRFSGLAGGAHHTRSSLRRPNRLMLRLKCKCTILRMAMCSSQALALPRSLSHHPLRKVLRTQHPSRLRQIRSPLVEQCSIRSPSTKRSTRKPLTRPTPISQNALSRRLGASCQ